MGWFTREANAFGREFRKQGGILLFGKSKRRREGRRSRRSSGAERQYRKAQRWARHKGFK